jgi:hypothetical protein
MRGIRRFVRFIGPGLLLATCLLEPARADEPPVALLNEWWQWALSMPAAVNPVLDNSGARCMLGQRGNLWFLAGNTGGRTVRKCTLAAPARVLIPVHNTACVPDAQRSEQQCADAVLAHWQSFSFAEARLDGAAQALIDQPPVPGESVFTIAVPKDGMLDLKPGLYRATAAAGRWAIVDLAQPGLYTLQVRAFNAAGVAIDVTYRLTVADVT